jgi:hypothetical protein
MKKISALVLSMIVLIGISACTAAEIEQENPIIVEETPITTPINPPQTTPNDIFQDNIPQSDATQDVATSNDTPQNILLDNFFETAGVPMPFIGFDGDDHALFFRHCNSKFSANSGFVRDVFAEHLGHRDFINKWNHLNLLDNFFITSLIDYSNYFEIIVSNDIPDEVIVRAFEEYNAHLRSIYDENHIAYSSSIFFDDDIAALLSRDEATVLSHFATEHVIVIDDKVYSPAWLYMHSVEDYEAVGISREMVEERLELITEFRFTAEATQAFEEKLSAFMERDVSFEEIANNRATR